MQILLPINGERRWKALICILLPGYQVKNRWKNAPAAIPVEYQISEVFDHTGVLMDHYIPSTLRYGLYYPDGQILDEVYVYGSFLQSKMYRNNVRCSDCHNPHSLKLKAVGNELCGKCHEKEKSTICRSIISTFRELTGLPASTATCPGNTIWATISGATTASGCRGLTSAYSSESPMPAMAATAISLRNGRLKLFAGGTDLNAPHFLAHAGCCSNRRHVSLPGLMKMVGDTSQPEIAQATALGILGNVPSLETNRKVISALQNDNALIRYSP
ncbi:MAG: cytochrome c3 family protein [Lewinellaceae bacterium]|nr:cytochrome c3 family protein [Lewinellaceae bacterium]